MRSVRSRRRLSSHEWIRFRRVKPTPSGFDPVSAAVYLAAPGTTPVAGRRDAEVALGWLTAMGLRDLLVPVRRWLAAYWSFEVDDRRLAAWCRTVLGADQR